jgi:hypothetical protein
MCPPLLLTKFGPPLFLVFFYKLLHPIDQFLGRVLYTKSVIIIAILKTINSVCMGKWIAIKIVLVLQDIHTFEFSDS